MPISTADNLAEKLNEVMASDRASDRLFTTRWNKVSPKLSIWSQLGVSYKKVPLPVIYLVKKKFIREHAVHFVFCKMWMFELKLTGII